MPADVTLDAFAGWVSGLRNHVQSRVGGQADSAHESRTYLNGAAADAARRLISIDTRRKAGVFFSSEAIAGEALAGIDVLPQATYIDPAMGAGDLLLAVAARLPLAESLDATLADWGHALRGLDLHEEFVQAAKLRLLLLAAIRTGNEPPPTVDIERLFPLIRVGNGLCLDSPIEATHILLNPPFGRTLAPKDFPWATGNTSLASVFVESVTARARPTATVCAILPDVLRTGSNYSTFRRGVEQRSRVTRVASLGRFDKWTDVDAFVLQMQIGEASRAVAWWRDEPALSTVGAHFDLSVGSVVPHRDLEGAPAVRYLSPRVLPTSGCFNVGNAPIRGYTSRLFRPPFVAIRRTSAPGPGRLKCVVVSGGESVSIENHLLVAEPKTGDLEDCERLQQSLEAPESDDRLNDRIRCRHLTTASVAGLPFRADV